MRTLNKLLHRQIEKHWKQLDKVPPDLLPFFKVVSESYDHYEKDRRMLERSMEITSSEMIDLNHKIRSDARELNMLINNIQEVFFSVDMVEYKTTKISAACEKVYGYSVSAFEQNPNLWREVIHEEDLGIIEGNYELMHAGKAFTQEYRIRHRDGSTRWVESKINPTVNREGVLVRLDGITADITKRKAAEEALNANERKFRALIQNSSDVISITDQDGVFSFISDSLTTYAGFTKEEVLGRKISDFVHPEDMEQFTQQASYLFAEAGNSVTIVARLLVKSGEYEWCEGVLTNLLHEPAVRGVIGNLRVITERKEAEEAIRANNEELKKKNSELDKFVYSVSHDLRAPLRSILGLAEISEHLTTDPLIQSHFEMIKSSVKRLDGFILDILDYSRNARMEIRKEEISFKHILSDVTGNLKYMGDNNRKVDIRIAINNGICFKSDKNRVTMILNNLISNAIRYQNPNVEQPIVDVTVDISASHAKIQVKDNGIGIKKEHREKIFEMFYRVSSDSVGSGLGLYIVKETVNKLCGTIELDSEHEQGTTVNILIPNYN